MNRRQFLAPIAATTAGCACDITSTPALTSEVDDGVYAAFRDRGFFVVRRGSDLFALSAICTHRRYRLDVADDRSFYCKGHGSCFDATGKVTEGPAEMDLARLATTVDGRDHLVATVSSVGLFPFSDGPEGRAASASCRSKPGPPGRR